MKGELKMTGNLNNIRDLFEDRDAEFDPILRGGPKPDDTDIEDKDIGDSPDEREFGTLGWGVGVTEGSISIVHPMPGTNPQPDFAGTADGPGPEPTDRNDGGGDEP